MIARCENPQSPAYKYYGGRGIRVCERWHDFNLFYADMGPAPPAAQIERIDNNGHYEFSNCKWATRKEQSNNRRSNIVVTVDGVTRTLKQWCEVKGLKYSTVWARFNRGNIRSPEEALAMGDVKWGPSSRSNKLHTITVYVGKDGSVRGELDGASHFWPAVGSSSVSEQVQSVTEQACQEMGALQELFEALG